MPSFWRSKPPPGTRLNYQHPLVLGLVCCVPLNEGGGRAQDLLSGVNGEATIASGTGLFWVGGQDGVGLLHDNTGTGSNDSSSLTFPNSCSPKGQAFTFWIRIYRSALGAQGSPIRTETSANGGFEFRVTTSDTLQLLRAEEAAFTASTGTVPVGWSDLAVAHASDNTYRYYLNGQDIGGGTSSGTFTTTKRINLGGSGASQPAQNGSISSQLLIWNRTLSPQEIATLTPDPYQLFEAPLWRRTPIPYQHAAPASDSSVGAWTTDTGGTSNLYQAIDEATASDADYIQSESAPSASAVEVTLTSLTDPVSSASHTLRYRLAASAASGNGLSLLTELRQGASALSTPASWTDTLSSATVALVERTLSSAQADAITDYSTLRLRWTATQDAHPPTAPTLVTHGTAAFTATNGATLAPGLPSGFAANDIHVMIAHRSDNTAMTALAGWTQIAALSGDNTAAQRVEIWWRRAVGGDSAPTVTFGSGTVVRGAWIIGVRGCPTSGDPFGETSRLANAAAATIAFTDVTTTQNQDFVLALGAYEDDPTTISTMGSFTQPASAVQGSSLGNDMMLCYEHLTKTTAGAAGATSVTVSGGTFANSVSVGILVTLKGAAVNRRAVVTWADLAVPTATTTSAVRAFFRSLLGVGA